MSIGMIVLIVLSLLILFGVLQRVLDRMALTDRQALAIVAAIFIGGWLPEIDLGLVTLNIGGAVIPLIVCVYLLLHAGTAKERIRALVASFLTAAAIFALGLLIPADPAQMPMLDPMILYGVVGGLIAWLLGRSRRSAFIAGVLGVILADVITGVSLLMRGVDQVIHLGGAGALDAVVLAGVIGVLCCELFGEIIERIQTGKANAPHEDGAITGGSRA
ncbi:MAG: DUF1614 domain-containing protein [Clostridiales bacterium]|nr:DUF1614 domain-containing protein [Clostridiales bacterium]